MKVLKADKSYQFASAELIEDLRQRGCGGGYIQNHRSLLTSPWGKYKFFTSVGLTILLFAGWLISMKWVSMFWRDIMSFWSEMLGIRSYVTIVHYNFENIFVFSAPYFHFRAHLPDHVDLLVGAVITFIVFLVTFFLPRRQLPLVYLLRVIVFFHASALLFFTFRPLAFPFTASGYIHGVLIAGLVLITLIPIVLALTYFIYDFSLLKKFVLTLLIMLHFVILIPMQFVAHAFILYNTSLLMLPLLFFIFGLPLDLMIFIALYSWGASWKNKLYREPVQRGNGFFETE